MLLPMAQTSEEDSESADPAKDFTVKKIFTYSYETSELLEKSAYLKGCKANEIHITAMDEKEDGGRFVFRQVDYRYGFYDTLDEFFRFRDQWLNPGHETKEEDLYIESLLPSPDGKQLLVYVRSAVGDTRIVWLYTLGSQDSLLLYEGILEQNGPMIGSFSPDGRWMTFDVTGSSTGNDFMVPIYDCEKQDWAAPEQYLELPGSPKGKSASVRLFSRLYPPDHMLYSASDDLTLRPWAAFLCDTSEGLGLLNFFLEEDKNILSFTLHWTDLSAPEPAPTPDPTVQHISSYLSNYDGIPYLQYRQEHGKRCFYYMGNPYQLIRTDMEDITSAEKDSVLFPDPVWEFLPLDTGDLLVLLVQEAGADSCEHYGNDLEQNANVFGKYAPSGAAGSKTVQSCWDIRSADLYLYPAEGTERRLLYKNVQNLLGMEYDAENRRILLETWENGDLTHRKCIILEL